MLEAEPSQQPRSEAQSLPPQSCWQSGNSKQENTTTRQRDKRETWREFISAHRSHTVAIIIPWKVCKHLNGRSHLYDQFKKVRSLGEHQHSFRTIPGDSWVKSSLRTKTFGRQVLPEWKRLEEGFAWPHWLRAPGSQLRPSECFTPELTHIYWHKAHLFLCCLGRARVGGTKCSWEQFAKGTDFTLCHQKFKHVSWGYVFQDKGL